MVFDPLLLLCSLLALTLAFIIHEYAHALSAYTLGDPTPKYEGRLSLNPIIHLDPVGSMVMLVTMMMPHVPVIGWARPVRVDRSNLKAGYLDVALVAFAGPFSNFVLAFGFGILCLLGLKQGPLGVLLVALVKANLGFGLFNCFPWPPLDGWKIITGLVPRSLGDTMYQLENRVGLYGVVGLLLLSPFLVSPVLGPIYFYLIHMLTGA